MPQPLSLNATVDEHSRKVITIERVEGPSFWLWRSASWRQAWRGFMRMGRAESGSADRGEAGAGWAVNLYVRQWQGQRGTPSDHPFCAYCQREGRVTAASVVEHITPHRDNLELYWSLTNRQPLCQLHHDRHKQLLQLRNVQGLDA